MKNGHFGSCTMPDNCWCEIKRYSLVFILAGIIFGTEVMGGIVSGSLSLLSDAGHVFTDAAAILVSIVTAYSVRTNGLRLEICNWVIMEVVCSCLFVLQFGQGLYYRYVYRQACRQKHQGRQHSCQYALGRHYQRQG